MEFYGPVLNQSARVAAAAHGGQVRPVLCCPPPIDPIGNLLNRGINEVAAYFSCSVRFLRLRDVSMHPERTVVNVAFVH